MVRHDVQETLVSFPVFPQGPPYDRQTYRVDVLHPEDDGRLAAVAALDAEIFAGHESLDVEELRRIANPSVGFVVAVSDQDGLIAEAQVITRATDEFADPLIYNMPRTYAYRAGIGVAPRGRGRRLGGLVVGACEGILGVLYPEITTVTSSCRPENGRNLQNIIKLGAIGVGLRTEYYPHGHTPGRPHPPSLYRHEGARLLMYRFLQQPTKSSYCVGDECHELDILLSDEPDEEARVNMDRLFSKGLALTGATRGSNPGTFIGHFCRVPLATFAVLPPFHL